MSDRAIVDAFIDAQELSKTYRNGNITDAFNGLLERTNTDEELIQLSFLFALFLLDKKKDIDDPMVFAGYMMGPIERWKDKR